MSDRTQEWTDGYEAAAELYDTAKNDYRKAKLAVKVLRWDGCYVKDTLAAAEAVLLRYLKGE